VAHKSEIPGPGDYVVRSIGEDSWIVACDSAGQVHISFNSCRHRGTQVCQEERGHAAQLQCPYHGWTYSPDGALIGGPNRQQACTRLDPSVWGLLQAPQVATYRGLIFACLDPAAPPLDVYLGDFRWYLDLHLGLWPDGMMVVGEPLRWRLDGNW